MVPRLVVLGGSGMLGSALARAAADWSGETLVTMRDPGAAGPRSGAVERFDAETDDPALIGGGLREGDLIINAIGVIRHLMRDDVAADRRRAVVVNAAFPYALADAAAARGARIVQIATDCVFSGRDGGYDESSIHDALDVYGRTKSLGEVPAEHVLNVRCSIIGPELRSKVSLQEWVLAHPAGSTISGYSDHIWNGVTTRTFSRIALGIARSAAWRGGTVHLVPADRVTKAELCSAILAAYGRDDVDVVAGASPKPTDRSLTTEHPEWGARLWADAGYERPPTIVDMVNEAARERGELEDA